MGYDYSLSASKLNILNDCRRCFWLHMTQKIERPRGIFPSLPGGMDRVMKHYLDRYRGSMPPELQGSIPGVLWGTVAEIGKLRQWQSGMKPVVQTPHGSVSLIGALDDLAVHTDLYSPVDGKTKGSAVKDGDTEKYYRTQGDTYHLMLRETGKKPSGKAYFFYLWPEGISGAAEATLPVAFNFKTITVETDADRVMALICKATELLSTSDAKGPAAPMTCEYCNHHLKLQAVGL